jgi:hypothetical protein
MFIRLDTEPDLNEESFPNGSSSEDEDEEEDHESYNNDDDQEDSETSDDGSSSSDLDSDSDSEDGGSDSNSGGDGAGGDINGDGNEQDFVSHLLLGTDIMTFIAGVTVCLSQGRNQESSKETTCNRKTREKASIQNM